MADQDRFARAVQIVARGLGRISRERARADEVTPQQAETLQLIAERGAVSTSMLAQLLGIDPSTASRNLAGLQKAGLVTRKKASEDGRQTDVRLTPKGKRAADAATVSSSQALSAVLDKINRGERQKVLDALEALAKVMDGDVPGGA
ncbi:MAG TPA: MarR family transcriptional regulator [Polyangiaceae bacterium]|nr:MarR family transcriptional regulator [Polyangiaceae bacterium]